MKIKLVVQYLMCLTCLPAFAQFSSAVQGTVLDPSSASVPDAKVRLTNTRTGITSETVSNATGFYRFSSLAPSDYELKVEVSGFRGSTVALALTTGQTRDLNVTLEVQSAGETVSVTSEAAALDTAESRQQLTMEQNVVRDIPHRKD